MSPTIEGNCRVHCITLCITQKTILLDSIITDIRIYNLIPYCWRTMHETPGYFHYHSFIYIWTKLYRLCNHSFHFLFSSVLYISNMPSNMDRLDAKLLDNIERLRDDGSNWKVWKAQTIIALKHQEVLDFIENPIPQPTPIYMSPGKATVGQSLRLMDTVANADDIAAWDRNNRISKMQIFMTLEHAVADLYDDKAVALELWNALQAHFEGKGLVAVAALAAQLWRYVMLPDKDMTVQ